MLYYHKKRRQAADFVEMRVLLEILNGLYSRYRSKVDTVLKRQQLTTWLTRLNIRWCFWCFQDLNSSGMWIMHITLARFCNVRSYSLHRVPKIVHVNRIIKSCFWYNWRKGEDNQMLKILECANVWFSRFPDFKVKIRIEFAVNSHCSLLET